MIVVRNAAGCITCAWLTSVCYSFGNILSGKLSHYRSRDAPDRPPTLWYCFLRLARATIVYFVATIVATLAFGYLVAYLAQVKPATFKYRFECYADIFSLILYFTGIAREMKRIYYEETCKGCDKLLSRKSKSCTSSNLCRADTPEAEALSVPVRYRAPVFWKAYVKQLPSFVPPMLATVASNIRTAVKGVVGMALVEIALRLVKAKVLQRTITQRQKAIFHQKNADSTGVTSILVEFQVWRRQVQTFHTVELNADMYAEYIAIGCSGSILFFFGTHPHYPLLRQSYSAEEIVDLSTWRLNQLYILSFQFGVEVVVDYISIALEMATGLEFDEIKKLGSFLAVLFMVTAVTNVIISIRIYFS